MRDVCPLRMLAAPHKQTDWECIGGRCEWWIEFAGCAVATLAEAARTERAELLKTAPEL